MKQIVTVEGQFASSINFAMQQNYVPIIRSLIVTNLTDEAVEDLTLKITFEPAFAKAFIYEIRRIEPQESIEIQPVSITLSYTYLCSLTERVVGSSQIEVYKGQELIFSEGKEIELLSVDEWSGLRVMPELICAFVTPNHPKVTQVINKAIEYLKKWTGRPEFTAYQTNNPACVKEQMAAIYAALQSEGIAYTNPIASYEESGQRIRLPHIVLQSKQGSCLDLAVLYAACLEAVGLYPLLIFFKEHAYAGCWLEEQTFADCAVDEVSALCQRMGEQAEELLPVECTDFVASKQTTFEQAVRHGKEQFKKSQDFIYVIDVKRSRVSGIRPMPVKIENSENQEVPSIKPYEGTKITKQKLWERKLLDFSLRNTLLNFKVTKNAIQCMAADLCQLEDELSEGKDFRILEAAPELQVSINEEKIYRIESERTMVEEIAAKELKNSCIRTFLEPEELNKDLKSLHRSAKVSMEENGSNTLFLALGFLRWYESDVSEKPRYAPIVLLPVDIVRNVHKRGYVIRSRQEEPQVNITLLEYLKQDCNVLVNGLDPLPMDEHGIDLQKVFAAIRQAIGEKKRWNIEEMAFMGIFSFGQFVMWNDIRNRSKDLEANKVVRSLIDGKMAWKNEGSLITAASLDKQTEPFDMALPMSADSSQMTAIAAAAEGKSFVLHGAPGTGKSQTITNMIATSLYQGKSVLFVAEKMAALNVVQKRLVSIGLDPFCLELHSNKTSKGSVLGQLNQALEVGRVKPPEEYQKAAKRLHGLRDELNYVIEAIHCKRQYGKSLYEAIELYEQNKDQKDKILLDKEAVDAAGEGTIEQWTAQVRQYVIAATEVGEYTRHPFVGYEGTEYSLQLRDKLEQDITELLHLSGRAEKSIGWLEAWSDITGGRSRLDIGLLLELCGVALNPAKTLKNLVRASKFEEAEEKLAQMIAVGGEYSRLYGELLESFLPQVFEYEVKDAMLRWNRAEVSWFLPKHLEQKKLLKELSIYAKKAGTVSRQSIMQWYIQLDQLSIKKGKVSDLARQLDKYLENLYNGVQTNWKELEDALKKADFIRQAIKELPDEKKEAFINASMDKESASKVMECQQQILMFLDKLKEFQDTYRVTVPSIASEDGDLFKEIDEQLIRYQSHLSELKSWVSYKQKEKQIERIGLDGVADAFRNGRTDAGQIENAFACSLYYELLLTTIAKDDRLARFQGKQYEDMIDQYKKLIARFETLTIQELVARLSEKVPASGMESISSSELGILKRAIKSNGRMMSIRKLFHQIPTLLRRLCPCMLMSPISVAQYIDPSFPKFDLVIFDEASQLPTCEAVGTIARAENVVVVGDPKQLPPTSFFLSNRIDEENCDKEDLESLLDDCLAISMPQEYLKWHYRSRHESLIAYSNMKYYDNKLYTFPSPNDLVSEVKLIHVDGYYDKGKTKQNRKEAEAVVAEIIRRLKDKDLRNDSIGVVTFNASQQNLIDDLLSDEFEKYPELEDFDSKSGEPVFIKNLENVQGDERDVILFSIGYGPDKDGNVSMNFGPLNREGGWRRLNVAISRARKQMLVYATIRPDQIELSRTRAEGLAGLKGFLEFAESGRNVVVSKAAGEYKNEDVVALEIAKAIKEMGYDVKCNIGCSEYKIDLAVVNPNDNKQYSLGILLDGENCRKASTAKDRFVLQPQVLEGLGWRIMRIWVLEWLDNPEYIKKKIKETMEQLLGEETIHKTEKREGKIRNIRFEKVDMKEEARVFRMPYESEEVTKQGTANEFYNGANLEKIRSMIGQILRKEAPISRRLLFRKILSAWEITRTGSRVENVFDVALAGVDKRVTKDEAMLFYWLPEQEPERYDRYRVKDQFGEKRSMDDISSYEIIAAMEEVLEEQIGVSERDMVRLTAKKFGYPRQGALIVATITTALHKAIEEERIHQTEEGKIIL